MVHSFEIAMIVIIATKILPRESGGGNNLRMLISRRRAPIDVEHIVPSHLATVRSTASEWRVLVARQFV